MNPSADSRDDRSLVLIVDDDPAIECQLTRTLQPAGYRTVFADTADSAVVIAEKYRPDVILLDQQMLISGDCSICRDLKSRPVTADVPMIFLVETPLTEDVIRRCLGSGGNDFLYKPIDRLDLLARLQVVLRRQAVQDIYRRLATLDPLTGLSNRRKFFEDLTRILSGVGRSLGECFLILADIDGLTTVNERYGYDLGDEVLLTFSRLVGRFLSAECLAARIGHDEFAVVLLNSTQERALGLANRIRNTFAAIAFDAESQPKHFTASLGLAACRAAPPNPSADGLVEHADVALCAAKQGGRGRLAAFWALDLASLEQGKQDHRHSRSRARGSTHRAFVGVSSPAAGPHNDPELPCRSTAPCCEGSGQLSLAVNPSAGCDFSQCPSVGAGGLEKPRAQQPAPSGESRS